MNVQLLDRYEIVKSLGSGGFGDTFLAKDTQIPSQKLVVIKRLKPANANSNTSTELIQKLFEKEASVLEDLGEHNSQIPKLYSYFSNDNEFYLVQEYIQGVSLNEIAPIGSEQAKTILSSLLTTLKYIHGKGIIHRDIKPENIILRDSDHLPVLIDFGAVKETMGAVTLGSGSTVSSVVIGTRGFMAPEQSSGRSVFSTDLYALGLTIIYTLTKKLPVEFSSDQQTGQLDWQSHVSKIDSVLAKVINKAIEMEPSRRYSSAEAMYQALHSLISSGAEPALPMETVRVAPSNEFLVTRSSTKTAETVVTPVGNSHNNYSNNNGKSKIATLLTVLIGIIVVTAGLGGGFIITQQIKEAEARAAQAEKEKQEAEQKRIEAEQKIAEDEKRQRELEQKRVEEERQRLAAEAERAKQERQRLAAERQRVQVLANQAKAMASGASATIGGIPGSKNIRSGPGTDYGVITQGYTGEGLDILDSSTDSGGHVWYKVYHYGSGSTGWIASQLVNF
ncbi:protein kinase [Synechocystis sp. B12]|nr:protein kinase [Synechocystis sp. B12]